MTLSPAMSRDVERLIELRNREEQLRHQARRLELVPTGTAQAQAILLFARASRVREERMALLRRCQLI